MTLLSRLISRSKPTQLIPQVQSEVAHLIGPAKLSASNGNLIYSSDGQRELSLSMDQLKLVVLYGGVEVTSDAIALASKHRLGMAWLTHSGAYMLGRLDCDEPARTLLRRLQHHAMVFPSWRLSLARWLVTEKIHAMGKALRHYQRQGKIPSGDAIAQLTEYRERLLKESDLSKVRGIEGAASALWFQQFRQLLRPPWKFERRVRRPPTDPINALLSFGYTLLYQRVLARLQASGLEASLGCLHEYRAGRMSLACDLMEALRIPVVDRWVLGCCHQGIFRESSFCDSDPELGVRLTVVALPMVVTKFEEHWHGGIFSETLDQLVKEYHARLRAEAEEEVKSSANRMLQETMESGSGGEESYL